MSLGLVRTFTVVLLATLLALFSVAGSAEIFHPIEETSDHAHHDHREDVLEGSHLHHSHQCVHLQNLAPAGQQPAAIPSEISGSSLLRTIPCHRSSFSTPIRGRGPPSSTRS